MSPTAKSPVVLLSGTRGLARAFAQTFVAEGARLAILARTESGALELEAAVQPDRAQWSVCLGNLADASVREAWVRGAVERFGPIDLLINNAAELGPGGRLGEISIEAFAQTIAVDLVAPAHTIQLVLPHLSARGTVINLSGGGATAARPFFSAYGAAKCALVRLTETLAVEYPEFRFFAIAPGAMKTKMMEQIASLGAATIGAEHASATRILEGGGASPEKVAELGRWLFASAGTELSGRLISAVWDHYREASADLRQVPSWWTLRRVDDQCRKTLEAAGAGEA